jgi:hypothetical protein
MSSLKPQHRQMSQLPMWSVSDEVWHASLSMEDSVGSGFDKGGKETGLSYVL